MYDLPVVLRLTAKQRQVLEDYCDVHDVPLDLWNQFDTGDSDKDLFGMSEIQWASHVDAFMEKLAAPGPIILMSMYEFEVAWDVVDAVSWAPDTSRHMQDFFRNLSNQLGAHKS